MKKPRVLIEPPDIIVPIASPVGTRQWAHFLLWWGTQVMPWEGWRSQRENR